MTRASNACLAIALGLSVIGLQKIRAQEPVLGQDQSAATKAPSKWRAVHQPWIKVSLEKGGSVFWETRPGSLPADMSTDSYTEDYTNAKDSPVILRSMESRTEASKNRLTLLIDLRAKQPTTIVLGPGASVRAIGGRKLTVYDGYTRFSLEKDDIAVVTLTGESLLNDDETSPNRPARMDNWFSPSSRDDIDALEKVEIVKPAPKE